MTRTLLVLAALACVPVLAHAQQPGQGSPQPVGQVGERLPGDQRHEGQQGQANGVGDQHGVEGPHPAGRQPPGEIARSPGRGGGKRKKSSEQWNVNRHSSQAGRVFWWLIGVGGAPRRQPQSTTRKPDNRAATRFGNCSGKVGFVVFYGLFAVLCAANNP